jgi:hypothetical protein
MHSLKTTHLTWSLPFLPAFSLFASLNDRCADIWLLRHTECETIGGLWARQAYLIDGLASPIHRIVLLSHNEHGHESQCPPHEWSASSTLRCHTMANTKLRGSGYALQDRSYHILCVGDDYGCGGRSEDMGKSCYTA